jgi:hypothetical protein
VLGALGIAAERMKEAARDDLLLVGVDVSLNLPSMKTLAESM